VTKKEKKEMAKKEIDYNSIAIKEIIDFLLAERDMQTAQYKKNAAVKSGRFETAIQYRRKEINLRNKANDTMRLLSKLRKRLK
jgi:hypothetical protein